MCGIFAAIRPRGSFSESEIDYYRGQLNCVSHRGPDATGFQSFSLINNNDVLLGHNRLAIIDLAAEANQPMAADNCIIVYNGEIFNYIELRAELEKEGAVFHTKSDTEVIIQAYRYWGSSAFKKFNGMWAFVLVDILNNKVIVSRDRFSIKPLYYYVKDGTWYFASEIKQLMPLLQKPSINEEVLHAFLNQALKDYSHETFFKEIEKVLARHNFILDMDSGVLNREVYWEFEPDLVWDEKEAITAFRDLFFDSIKLRLRSDVKLGSLLSGGLDSSAITVVGKALSGDNFESFSVVSKEKKYSEEVFIDKFNHHTGIKNNKVVFQPEMVLENIEKVLNHQDEPFGSLSVVAQYLIFREIKNNTDIIVVLSGQGGDEALMGYNKYYFFNLKNNLRKGRFIEVARQVLGSLIYRTVLTNINLGHSRRYFPGVKNKSYLKLDYENENIWESDDLRSRQILDFEKYSVPSLAHYEDKNSMAHSLEVRHPFLDHRLVNFTLGVSDTLKIKNGWTKYLLRKSIHELPDEIRWRRDKQGFVTPDEKWMKSDLKPLIVKQFKDSVLHAKNIIDAGRFLKSYSDFADNKNQVYFNDIFRVFIAELWAKQHFK